MTNTHDVITCYPLKLIKVEKIISVEVFELYRKESPIERRASASKDSAV